MPAHCILVFVLGEGSNPNALAAAYDHQIQGTDAKTVFKHSNLICNIPLLTAVHTPCCLRRHGQAVAVRAAPELILLACEVKVAARRGADLLRTYGQYHFLGKLVALAQRSKVAAKYVKVTERLRSLMPAASAAAAVSGVSTPPSTSAGGGASPFSGHATGGQSTGGSGSAGPLGALDRTMTGGGGELGAVGGGQMLRQGHHERVYAVSFAPPSVATASGGMCVWWALESGVEFYSDATQSTTSFATEGDVFLTYVAIDDAGNTWGGTSQGTLLMRRPRVWDSQAEERLFPSAVRAITFDSATGAVWAGDERGCLRAARLREDTGRIQPLLTVLAGAAPARRWFSASVLLGR